MTQPQVDRRRVTDVTNSPKKQFNSEKRPATYSQHDQTQGSNWRSRLNPRESKENTTAQKRRAEREHSSNNKSLSVHDRLGDLGFKEQKRFKASQGGKTECPNGMQGTGEKGHSSNNRDRRAQYNEERPGHSKRPQTHKEDSDHHTSNRTTKPAQRETQTCNQQVQDKVKNQVQKSAGSDPSRNTAQIKQTSVSTSKQVVSQKQHDTAPTPGYEAMPEQLRRPAN